MPGPRICLGLNDGAVKDNSGKIALAARIGQYLFVQLQARRVRGLPPDGSRHRSIGSQFELVAEKALKCVFVHKQHNEVR